jgi:hypothetical protein
MLLSFIQRLAYFYAPALTSTTGIAKALRKGLGIVRHEGKSKESKGYLPKQDPP